MNLIFEVLTYAHAAQMHASAHAVSVYDVFVVTSMILHDSKTRVEADLYIQKTHRFMCKQMHPNIVYVGYLTCKTFCINGLIHL